MTSRYRRLFDLRLGGRGRADAEMDLEIESHLAMRVADLVRMGMTPDDARAEAMRRFGNFDSARQRLHAAARQRENAVRQRYWLGSLVADLRYAARQGRRAPGFTLLAVVTLALGIGAITTMFTLVERVLLRPLPFAHPEQLIAMSGLDSTREPTGTISAADWLDWRRARTLQGAALSGFPYRQAIVLADSATRIDAERVTGNYFDVLQPRFVAGRPFNEAEALANTPVAVISERLWRRLFSANPRLDAPLRTPLQTYTIVGVVAAGQDWPAGTDVWFPVGLSAGRVGPRVNVNWNLIVRRRPDVTDDQVAAEIGAIARGIRAADPTALYDYGVDAQSLGDSVVGKISDYLKMLMGVVVVVLLIVCANVAASGLARASARSREMAVRTSLGAVRGRLIQQLLIEHVWLGLAGGALGLLFAWAAIRLILARWGGQIPRAAEISLDAPVFLFTLAASLAAGALAGLVPALRVTRVSLSTMLASGGRTQARGGRNLAGASLVAFEIALALLLLTGAGLLIRSFRAVIGRGIGFDTNVATAEIALSGPLYARDTVRRFAYWDQLIESYRAIPSVQAAAVTNWIPLGFTGTGFIDVQGHEGTGGGAVYRTVSDDFFRVLRLPLLAGRGFTAQDGRSSGRVVIINHAMAAKYWPGESPLGKLVRARGMEPSRDGRPADWLTIIGVVGDVRTYGLETEPRPEMYVDFRQTPIWTTGMTAIVRGSVPAPQLLGEMRRRAQAIDPHVAADVGTIDDRLHDTLATRVLTMSLLSCFAAIALLLAALGIYGVLSYAVTQRTRELAVRSALGAGRRDLLGLVLGSGLRVVVIGMSFGVVASLWLTSVLNSMLVGVKPLDPLSYVGAIMLLFVVCAAAILVPSLRATRLDPMIALQAE